jgi:multiple sugar transport system substrate-binding protein
VPSGFLPRSGNLKLGYSDALLDLGRLQGRQYGIGFSLSTPIVYYNADLVRKAGGDPDRLPISWPEIFALANKIKALGGDIQGLHFDWDITGNWMFQALVFSNGGTMLSSDEKRVAFDGPAGDAALKTLAAMVASGTMRDVSQSVSLQDFISGRLGIWSHSTSRLGGVMRQVAGKFDVRTGVFPVPASNGRLPAGGNVAIMFARTPERQMAAWEYIKFATGPIGATIMVKGTGYFPANTLPASDPRLLADYYRQNPNHLTAIRQLDRVTNWYAFPGENGLKITDVIKDNLQSVVNKSAPPEAALKKMAIEVQALLPR